MKKILYILIATFAFSATNAQTSFNWLPNDSIVQDIDDNDYAALIIEQVNTTSSSVTLGIEIVHNSIPLSWDGMVCIFGTCFGQIPPVGFTGVMNPISGITNGYVRLTANPMGGTASAMLRVYVYDMNSPNDGDTCTWIVQPVSMQTSLQEEDGNKLSIYPNPSSDKITISSLQLFNKIIVSDIQGKQVLNSVFENTTATLINVSALNNGVYFIKTYTDGMFMETQKFTISE